MIVRFFQFCNLFEVRLQDIDFYENRTKALPTKHPQMTSMPTVGEQPLEKAFFNSIRFIGLTARVATSLSFPDLNTYHVRHAINPKGTQIEAIPFLHWHQLACINRGHHWSNRLVSNGRRECWSWHGCFDIGIFCAGGRILWDPGLAWKLSTRGCDFRCVWKRWSLD